MRTCRKLLLSCSLLFVLPLSTVLAQQPIPAHWGYAGADGPEHWSQLDPANSACALGHMESPIDLRGAKRVALPELTFDYHPAEWKIVDNGHTVQVIVPPGSSMISSGHRYELVQFHFHHPSEEAIAGKHFDMVIHMVHKDADGHLAVVAVLLADGDNNAVIQKLWDSLPKSENEVKPVAATLDPTQLLPVAHGYYTFEGSLTTPPCTEGVRWFVMKSPLKISVAEEQAFAKLFPNNARPLQPWNGRTVQVSK
ncbi:carbonic anhydrase [Granulicella sibirica]|uniref:carbonic anhydrase n=1 Tax=Granulicella sibirica TaxID=2479048 RepID=A0A4Q0T0W3_9BACT|nr:carbonic anhydrase family protein [Granulicella sibirica]RXH55489.1 Carbonic anhydrase [Granulicella sibirica]